MWLAPTTKASPGEGPVCGLARRSGPHCATIKLPAAAFDTPWHVSFTTHQVVEDQLPRLRQRTEADGGWERRDGGPCGA